MYIPITKERKTLERILNSKTPDKIYEQFAGEIILIESRNSSYDYRHNLACRWYAFTQQGKPIPYDYNNLYYKNRNELRGIGLEEIDFNELKKDDLVVYFRKAKIGWFPQMVPIQTARWIGNGMIRHKLGELDIIKSPYNLIQESFGKELRCYRETR
jgi:hypothetical protein